MAGFVNIAMVSSGIDTCSHLSSPVLRDTSDPDLQRHGTERRYLTRSKQPAFHETALPSPVDSPLPTAAEGLLWESQGILPFEVCRFYGSCPELETWVKEEWMPR